MKYSPNECIEFVDTFNRQYYDYEKNEGMYCVYEHGGVAGDYMTLFHRVGEYDVYTLKINAFSDFAHFDEMISAINEKAKKASEGTK